jgi:hypothetical protein
MGSPVWSASLDSGSPQFIPLYAFSLMRALAKKLDTSPWAKQLPLHRLIVDVIRLGTPVGGRADTYSCDQFVPWGSTDCLGPLKAEGKGKSLCYEA